MPKIINIKITASEVNEVIGRKQTDNWQGMTSVNGEKAEKLIEYVKSHIKTL